MRKSWILPVALLTLGVVVAACTGSSGGDTTTSTPTPSPSPSPATLYDFTLTVTNWVHNSAGVRVIQTNGGAARAVVFCQTPSSTAATWSVSTAQLMSATYAYNVEVFGDVSGPGVYDLGTDHTWYLQRGVGTTTNFNVSFSHGMAQTPITWANGQGCPGG